MLVSCRIREPFVYLLGVGPLLFLDVHARVGSVRISGTIHKELF